MADEREGQDLGRDGMKSPANEDKIQTAGRKANDARPLNASPDDGGPERYPSVRQDDAVERTGRSEAVTGESRSFDPAPKQGAGDTSPAAAKQDGFRGPEGDPAEGKR